MKTMFNSRNNIIARAFVMLFALVGALCGISAESSVSVDNFTVLPGQEKEIAVNFANGDDLAGLQMNFTLPEGLAYVGFRNNEDRIERGVHSVNITPQKDGSYMILVVPSLHEAIPGESGALIYLTVKAKDTFKSQGVMTFDRINATGLMGELVGLDAFNVAVSPEVGHIAVGEEAFSVKQDGGKHRVEVYLNNNVDLYNMSGRITLPAGLSIEKNDRGRFVFTYGSRLSTSATVTFNEATGKFVLYDTTNGSLGNEGMLFSFNVVANSELALKSDIIINDVEVSDLQGVNYYLEDEIKVAVTNSYKADFEPAIAVANELQTKLDEAKATIAEECKDVKDSETLVAAAAVIQTQIDGLKTAIQEAYDNETLAATKDEVLAPKADIEAAITKFLEDAKAAQTAYDEEQAKIAANEEANTRLTAEIAELQTKLDAAKETVATECKDVAADFAEAETAIQKSIDDIAADVKAKYDAVELNAESSIADDAAAVEAAIAKLLEDAKAAQTAYDEEQAKIAANEEANTRLTAEIAELQTKLDAAKETVATECKDVASDFAEAETAVQKSIDDIAADVKAKYDAVELNAESSIADDAAAVEAAITKLLEDAKAAQTAYDEEQAKIAANEEANTRLTAEIAELQTKLDAAKETVATECKDVAADFAEAETAIQKSIDDIAADVKAKYDAVELNAESSIADDAAAVEAAITKLLEDAKAAQTAYDEEQAKIAANEEANTRLTAEIAELQETLDAAKKTIETEYANVAGSFTADEAAIQKSIDDIAADVKVKYDAVELNAESSIADDAAAVEAAITKLLEDAKAAQTAYDEEQAKIAANEEANTRLTAEIAELQEALDAAKKTIETEYANVAGSFTADEAAIQKSIDDIAADVKVKYDAVELNAESSIADDAAAVEAAITKLLEDAKAAHEVTTGINRIGISVDGEAKFYTLSGERVAVPAKGQVYIMKTADGKTKKVFMK